jgi:hypothetical protein
LKRFGIEALQKTTLNFLGIPRGGFLQRVGIETLQKNISRLLKVPGIRFLEQFRN